MELVPVLGSVTDARRVERTFAARSVEIVLHAAAYKHVPLVETNELEGVRNNVLGTRIIAEAAERAGVERFILISTDKAVRPANVMGATKRLAEMVVQDLARRARDDALRHGPLWQRARARRARSSRFSSARSPPAGRSP